MVSAEHGLFETVRSETDMSIARSSVSFVGTAIGYRTYGGAIIDDDITDCWYNTCQDLAGEVMSVVLRVDNAIEGVEDRQLFEEIYGVGDGDCGPEFQPGQRYLYGGGTFGAVPLPDPPTVEQLAHWRDLARLPAWPRPRDVSEVRGAFGVAPDEIVAALAAYRPSRAFVARIVQFRLDDASLTTTSPCNDQLAPECVAFKRRMVSLLVAPETAVAGEPPPGTTEVPFGGPFGWLDAPSQYLPATGRLLLVMGRFETYLLASPPDEAVLDEWRRAARAR